MTDVPRRASSSDIPAAALREIAETYEELRRELAALNIDTDSIDRIAKRVRGRMLNASTESQRAGVSYGGRIALAAIPLFVACRCGCGATVDVPR